MMIKINKKMLAGAMFAPLAVLAEGPTGGTTIRTPNYYR